MAKGGGPPPGPATEMTFLGLNQPPIFYSDIYIYIYLSVYTWLTLPNQIQITS